MRRDERPRDGIKHYASVCVLSASGAVLAAYAYLHVRAEIVTVEQAQGYVDPLLQAGIVLGFAVMLITGAALSAIAVWSAVRVARGWKTGRGP
jgi:hypothetical protein